jgi:hypothetical protein
VSGRLVLSRWDSFRASLLFSLANRLNQGGIWDRTLCPLGRFFLPVACGEGSQLALHSEDKWSPSPRAPWLHP